MRIPRFWTVSSHNPGHFWSTLFGLNGDPHFSVLHIFSTAAIIAGFLIILFGFLPQWPTFLTLLMFPLLVVLYVRLAHTEEGEARRSFGSAYERYEAVTPGWFPRLGRSSAPT